MVLLHLQCPSGCYRRFVILLAVPSPSFGQLLCPSRHFVHFFLRSASLHLVRSYSFASRPGIPLANAQTNTQGNAPAFRKPTLQYSPGSIPLHYVIHSLQQRSVHPLPIIFARRLSPFRLRSLSAALITMPDTWLIRPSFRHAALSSLASFRRLRTLTGNILRRLHMELASPFVPHGFTASPSWGLAGTSGRSSLPCLTAARLQRYSPAGLRGGLTFFFAAGAFTGRLATFAFASKKALLNYKYVQPVHLLNISRQHQTGILNSIKKIQQRQPPFNFRIKFNSINILIFGMKFSSQKTTA